MSDFAQQVAVLITAVISGLAIIGTIVDSILTSDAQTQGLRRVLADSSKRAIKMPKKPKRAKKASRLIPRAEATEDEAAAEPAPRRLKTAKDALSIVTMPDEQMFAETGAHGSGTGTGVASADATRPWEPNLDALEDDPGRYSVARVFEHDRN